MRIKLKYIYQCTWYLHLATPRGPSKALNKRKSPLLLCRGRMPRKRACSLERGWRTDRGRGKSDGQCLGRVLVKYSPSFRLIKTRLLEKADLIWILSLEAEHQGAGNTCLSCRNCAQWSETKICSPGEFTFQYFPSLRLSFASRGMETMFYSWALFPEPRESTCEEERALEWAEK